MIICRVTNWPARPAVLASSREKWPLLSVSLIYSLYSPVISFLISLNSHIFTLIFTTLQNNGVGQVVDDEGDSAYFGTTSGDVVKVRSLMMVIIVMVKSTITLQSIVDNILLLYKIALNSKSGGAPAIVSASVRSVSLSKHNWDRNPTKIMWSENWTK